MKSADRAFRVPARKTNCIDTTGAGDLYATSFLFGMACELPLESCGEIASLVAGRVVEVLGAKIPDIVWEEIRSEVSNVLS